MKLAHNLFAFVAILLTVGCTTLPESNRIRSQDTKHTYVLQGNGAPTVVLESGLGDGKESWGPIYKQIGDLTQVIAYDRAGYGQSRSKNWSRSGSTIVKELRQMLQSLKLQPPYILVGHSLGGTYMELYARTYPGEVAAVILVDSRHADFTHQCQQAGVKICAPPAILSALMPIGPRRELAGLDSTIDEVNQAGPFPEIPLVVLTSGKHALTGQAFDNVWIKTQKDLATLSTISKHTICNECGHYIQNDAPDLVIDAIKSMIEQVRINP